MVISLPENLNVPKKLLPLITEINKYRYFLIEGGRSSGKSQSVARFILWLCEQKSLRVVCGRETQNTIEESVYALFSDIITNYNLNFDVPATKIEHRDTKSIITFKGLREQGRVNIQGLEGVDVLWVDESQSITKPTLDIIIPTIRTQNSKIIFTMNRFVEEDPVFVAMVNRADCLHIHVDYFDNKFCPEAMVKEAELCKETSLVDYNHIWLGQPLAKGDDYLFGIDELRASISLDFSHMESQRAILSNDPARFGDCENVFSILRSRGGVFWEQVHTYAVKGIAADETVGKHSSMHRDFSTDMHVIDCDGLGGPIRDLVKDTVTTKEFYAVKDYDSKDSRFADRRTEAYFKLHEWIKKGWLKISNDPVLVNQLLSIRIKYKSNGKLYVMSKDDLLKDGIASPDRADTLMMGVYFADSVARRKYYQPQEMEKVY